MPSASPPPRHCKHKVGFTFTFTLAQRRRRIRRPRNAGLNPPASCILSNHSTRFEVSACTMFSPKSESRVWRLPPDIIPGSILVRGQVDKWRSVLQLSGQRGQTRAQHMSGLRPGRWPELLAPIRSRNPPRISRARPYGRTNCGDALEGQTDAKGRRGRTDYRGEGEGFKSTRTRGCLQLRTCK